MGYATSDYAANPLCRAALGGGVSDKERTDILNWIADQRERHYASADTDAAHRNEPVQPIPRTIPVDAKKVHLGFRLYHDERLSGDSTISCAHCHALNAGGVDGRKTSIGVGGAVGPINAPTVFNSVFNIEQFWDGRAATLQAQAGGPPLNPIEMASKSWDEIISKLDKDPVLKKISRRFIRKDLPGKILLMRSPNLKKR